MIDKQYTSNTEDNRLNIEESFLSMGKRVLPHQIWRDGGLIPGSPDDLKFNTPEVENGCIVRYSYLKDGETVLPLVKKIEKLPLLKLKGTDDSYYNKEVENLIGREFDKDCNDLKKSWQYILYINEEQVSYDVGKPLIDISTGVIKFRSAEFLEKIKDDSLYLTFYKYIGRTGFLGSYDNKFDSYGGIDIPFRDDVKHFKNSLNDNQTLSIKVDGYEGNTVYMFPPPDMYFNNENFELDENYNLTSIDKHSGTVMLQENYQEIDWNIGLHNGGVWLEDGSVRKF